MSVGFKTNFMVLDECLDGYSVNNESVATQLVENIKKNYFDHVFVISHDLNFIHNKCTTKLNVVSGENGSCLFLEN